MWLLAVCRVAVVVDCCSFLVVVVGSRVSLLFADCCLRFCCCSLFVAVDRCLLFVAAYGCSLWLVLFVVKCLLIVV